jgi:hypothetical protein
MPRLVSPSLRAAIVARAIARLKARRPNLSAAVEAIVIEFVDDLLEELSDAMSARHRQNGGESAE